jgi:DNA adenine methylase
MTYNTPLRYPGGKGKLAEFVRSLFKSNSLTDGQYVETYAGGAAIAFDLLFLELASHVHLNDINAGVFSFWRTVLQDTEWLCKKIVDTPVSIAQWWKQKKVYSESGISREIGFAFFFLNRTNRSGILNGGVIGGLDQTGEWKIDARYNKSELVRRVQKIADYRSRISIYRKDAMEFLKQDVSNLTGKTLVYLDPPYFVKGRRLYQNHYKPRDHEHIAGIIQSTLKQLWIISYDNVPEIATLYPARRKAIYDLDYSASKRSIGSEVMFFSDAVRLPSSLPKQMHFRLQVAKTERIVKV